MTLLSLLSPIVDLASEFIEDPDQRNRLIAEVERAEARVREGQIALNKAEAQHASLFVSGWRPAIGWMCFVGLVYAYLIRPTLSWVSGIFDLPSPPMVDLEGLYPLILGMLGLGAARSYEKARNVARNRMK